VCSAESVLGRAPAAGLERHANDFMEILNQLGELFLAAVPTVVLVFLFYLFLRWSFFRPIMRVMAERNARIEGARREAESFRTTAQEKTRAYQETLRKTRAEIFSEQEAARRVVLEERSVTVQQARNRANEEIHAAKARIATEIEAARSELEASGNQLAEEIAQAVFERATFERRPVGESK
jgi:F0F1-type ATP synthase membrane subunit b/b'